MKLKYFFIILFLFAFPVIASANALEDGYASIPFTNESYLLSLPTTPFTSLTTAYTQDIPLSYSTSHCRFDYTICKGDFSPSTTDYCNDLGGPGGSGYPYCSSAITNSTLSTSGLASGDYYIIWEICLNNSVASCTSASSSWGGYAQFYYNSSSGLFSLSPQNTATDISSEQLCSSLITQSSCQANSPLCAWAQTPYVGCNVAYTSVVSSGSYSFANTDFGFLGNMVRDVLVALILPDPVNASNQFSSLKSQFINKLPFAYVNALQIAWTTAQSNVSTSGYPQVSVPNPFPGRSGSMYILNFSTVPTLVGSSTWTVIQNVIGYLFWIGAFIFIWETIHKNNSTKL